MRKMKKDRDFQSSNALEASAALDLIKYSDLSQEELARVLTSAARLLVRVSVGESWNISHDELPEFDSLDASRYCKFSIDSLLEHLIKEAGDNFQESLRTDGEQDYITDHRRYKEGA